MRSFPLPNSLQTTEAMDIEVPPAISVLVGTPLSVGAPFSFVQAAKVNAVVKRVNTITLLFIVFTFTG